MLVLSFPTVESFSVVPRALHILSDPYLICCIIKVLRMIVAEKELSDIFRCQWIQQIPLNSLVPLQYHMSTTDTPIKLIHCSISCSEYRIDTGVSEKMYVTNLSRYAPSICRGLSNVVHDTKTFFNDDTTTNSQASGCWSLVYRQTEVPASQEPSQGQDSHPIFVTTTHRVDCSVQGRESYPQGQEGLHHVST